MNPKSILRIIIASVLIINYSCDNISESGKVQVENEEYLTKAMEMFDSVYTHFYIPEQDLFMENFPRRENDNEVSWLWPYVCFTAGVNSLMHAGVTDDRFLAVIDGFERYFDTTAVPAYGSYPFDMIREAKYYDDNAIVGIELMDAYELTGDEKYLHQAKQAMHFIFTGESKECDGGVYWNENEFGKNGEKGISANGFGTYLALQLYKVTGDEQYLIFAKRIYSWVLVKLKNPENQIFWNGILPEDCSVRKNIWVYNTGIMIQNSILFYEITGEEKYINEASTVAAASFKEFTKEWNEDVTFIYDVPWFKTVLLKSYLHLSKYDNSAVEYIRVFARDVDHAWENKRNEYGFIAEDWTGNNPGGEPSFLNQGCIIEIYARLALSGNLK